MCLAYGVSAPTSGNPLTRVWVGKLTLGVVTGYLIFSHGAEIPDALIQSVFADYEFWSHEADFDGHEGVFYRCGMTDMLNRDVGNLQQKISIAEVCIAFWGR